MISKIKKPVSILLSLIMVFSVFAIVPLSASAAHWYHDLARGTLIRPGDTFSFEDIGSFKFADYNDPTIIHEVKGSDFSYNQETLSVTDGYYSFGSTKLLPTSVSPGGLLIADYDSTTKMATFGVQNITHSFDETTGTLTIGGSGVVPPNYAFTGSDVYDVVFTQSNLVKHLIIDATDMIAIKQDAFMAYTGGCVLEDVEINSTSSTPLIIEENAVFYESDNTVTITVNAVKLATVTSCPVGNYGSPVNLIYNVQEPITFNQRALSSFYGDLTVTIPTGSKVYIPGGAQFTDSQLQEEYDMFAEYGDEEIFWNMYPDLVEGTDYVLGDARYEELTPLNASLVVGNDNTALFSAYTITDESVNGTVTASVNGTDVTEAAADADVLLTVAPDNGYQFKSISATYPKNKVEEFSDLVALMGDAVFSAADYADHPEYTCKVNDGKFVVYDGDTSVAELSEANMTNAELGGTYFSAQCGGLEWNLYFRDGIITDIYAYDSDYNYIFASADGSKSTGTLLPTVVNLTTVTEGSQYSLTMPKMPVTVTAEFEEAPASASASFVKVTDEPDDWSGDYLIVYEDEDGSTAFNGSADELNSKGNYIDVTISGGEIESNAATDAAKVTIAQIDGGYSIATVGGAYIGGVSGLNKLDFRDEAILNTISLEDDSAKIVSNTSTLRFNTTWVGFRYYKTVSQRPVQLYKLTGGSAPTTYTVTWKNGDSVIETDTGVAAGTTPTYDGTTPEKAEDENYTYTFSGWKVGETTYALNEALPPVTGDVTYTAQFTATAKTFKVYVKKPTNETYTTIENLTGETTVAQLKEIIADQIDIPVTAQQMLIFAGKKIDDAKTLAEYNIGNESTIFLVIRGYTVTWLNYDNSELGTTTVQYGSTPTYDGETPTKPEDEQNTYTFSGWKVGETTYGLSDTLPAVSGDVTYTAQFDATAKPAPTYTVTWKNGDTVLKTDTVEEGATPTYNGETPTKDGVTFVGWTDSHGVFYAKDAALPEVTADETYTAVFELTIGSVDEWNSFAASVKGGNTYSGIIVRMTADVGPVTTMVDGTFSGTFDGDGHTLTVNISGGSTSAATFAYVKDATIQNLRLEGTVTSSGIHTAALVKSVSDTGSTCTIKNVDIYADVNCSNGYIGGFIGHAGTANTVNIENSIFAGSINKTGATQGFIGAFIGWSQTLKATINNCAFTGSYDNIQSFNNIGFSYNAPTKVTVSGFYSNASEVFVANVNHGTRLYVPSSSYPTTVALVKNNDGETFYSAFSDALAAWTDGSTLALLADVTCDSLITVPAADTKTLDLNGNALSLSYSSTKVEVNGTLTIQSTASGGSITPTTKSRVINVVDGGTLNIESGTINGYNADRAVIGGVGTINLNGGKIVTPASNAFSPDGVATLNLNGGEIECTSGSTSMGTASAVWAHGDSTINWNGTAITTNTGDGIRMKSAGNGTVNVTGGSFTATSSSLPEEGGYAIYCNSNMVTLNLEGNPSISGRGIYLTNDKVINITNDLSNTNPICVTMQTPGVFTSGLSGNGDASNFANGNGTGYALTLNASGEAQIVSTYTITWKNGDTVLETDTDVAEGATPTYDGATPYKADGADCIYTFSGWTPEVSAVTGDATYTATFTESEKPETIKDCNNKYGNFRLYSNVPIVSFSNVDDLLTGAIIPITYGDSNTMIPLQDAKGYSYKFYDQTGTEIPAQIASSSSAPGSNYELSDDVTVYTNVINFTRPAGCTAIYIVATEPAPSTYTITWNNYDDTEIGTSTVDADENPVFSDAIGEIKEYPDDDYTFAGWTDSNGTFYAKDTDLPAASADETYTATFEKLALKHSVTLNGNVNLNYYLNPDLVKVGDTVSFTWDVEDAEGYGTHSYTVKESDLRDDGYFVYVGVPAAEMTYGITASVNGVSVSDTFSVRDYCEAILADDSKSAEIKDLVKAMLYYGAKAQIAFGVKTDDLANAGVGADYDGAYADLTEAMINGAIYEANNAYADDLTDLPIGDYKTTSLFFLTRNIIRHYFKNTDASDSWTGITNDNYYRYVDSGEIAAAELDELQTFTVDGTTFRYSALDYVKELLKSDNVAYKNLAYATYWYNQKANTYFDNLNNN